MSLIERYKEDGIWTMDTPRDSCVVPERPLIIEPIEERLLNELALAAWRALEVVTGWANENVGPTGEAIASAAAPFPEGASMPPAVRIDVVRTANGPRIVEIDPISAISLGETASLQKIWNEQGYQVPGGLVDAVAAAAGDRSELAIDVPTAKREYKREIEYLARELKERGIDVTTSGSGREQRLSAFNDVAAIRRAINRDGWSTVTNPLWGSLIGMASKANLDQLYSADKVALPRYLPRSYGREELTALDPTMLVVAKPLIGTGSMGVVACRAGDISKLPQGYAFQELLSPVDDDFGAAIDRDGRTINQQWVSRVSIYAGRYGLLGAQVTARSREQDFTNVHGQSDAIQTTLAVTRRGDES